MTPKQQAVKARLLAETKARHDKIQGKPGFWDKYAAWEREYGATVRAQSRTRRPALLDLDLALRAERKLRRYGLTLNNILADIVKTRGLPKWLAQVAAGARARTERKPHGRSARRGSGAV